MAHASGAYGAVVREWGSARRWHRVLQGHHAPASSPGPASLAVPTVGSHHATHAANAEHAPLSSEASRTAELVLGTLQVTVAAVVDLDTAGVVGVEEILIVILLGLPLGKGEEDGAGNAEQNERKRVVIDTERLARPLAAGLVTSKRAEIERALHTENRLRMGCLGVESNGSSGDRWSDPARR